MSLVALDKLYIFFLLQNYMCHWFPRQIIKIYKRHFFSFLSYKAILVSLTNYKNIYKAFFAFCLIKL